MKHNRRGRRAPMRRSNVLPRQNFRSRPFAEFSKFVVETERQHVEEFSENNRTFIPLPILRRYWTKGRIKTILNAFHPPLSFHIDVIQDGYIRTFSMLVHCDRVADLEYFTKYDLNDNRLPLKRRPDEWDGDFFGQLFNIVYKYQWRFFPLIFRHTHLEDRYLDSNQILPIIELERITHDRITQGDAAIIQKMTIHDSCNFLVHQNQKSRAPIRSMFVLKTYHRPRFQVSYENEIRALRTLKNSSPPNIITYYGSFRQNGTYNIILEYADGGDLAEFFKRTQSPRGDDVKLFWESLSQCFRGLHCIHHLMDDKSVNGIHEDIKPENILLIKGASGSYYDFIPKIADFGLFTHVRESKAISSEAMGNDKVGNQLYSSPECSHHASYQESAPNMINTRADIFSFGAVLSEACAWIKGGFDETNKYLQQRRAYHRTIQTFCGTDYEGCFHDGVRRLPVVDEIHTSIRQHCESTNDIVTPRVIDIIDEHMLLPIVNTRYNAKQLEEKFQQAFHAPDQQIPNPLPEPRVLNPPSGEQHEGLSLEELGKHMARRQSTTSRDRDGHLNHVTTEIQKLVDDLKVNVPDRHHLFFIDDSTSMKEHEKSIKEVFPALLDVTRKLEGHKVELSFASGPKRPYSRRRSKKLIKLVGRQEYRQVPDLMESCFGRLVDNVIIPHLPMRILGMNIKILARKPTSVYVFTDGNWGGDEEEAACGVERPIARLTQELEERGLDRNHISFHFVRFGDDANGRKHLNYLDRSGQALGRDNVDVKTISSSIKSIVIGPLSQRNDNSDEDEEI